MKKKYTKISVTTYYVLPSIILAGSDGANESVTKSTSTFTAEDDDAK